MTRYLLQSPYQRMALDERWCPISIMLSMYGSRINSKLLFRYPFDRMDSEVNSIPSYTQMTASTLQLNKKQPVAVSDEKDVLKTCRNELEQIESFSDEVLGHILSPGNTTICGKQFDLKINGIRFVGFPLVLEEFTSIKARYSILKDFTEYDNSSCHSQEDSTLLSFNVVFVLKAKAEYAIVEIFQELALQLGIALRFEEKCCHYLTEETRLMLSVHDEISLESDSMASTRDAYAIILDKSGLAFQLSTIFNNLRENGVVNTRINNSTLVSFCLPHKVHNMNLVKGKIITVDSVKRVIEEMRPYHGILIFNKKEVFPSLPDDYSPSLTRFLSLHEPRKSLQVLSSDTDLPLTQIYEVSSKLVYWGKAMVIYPMCDSNVYMTAPCADLNPLSEKLRTFFMKFSWDLREVLSHFSLPTRLSDLHQNPHEFFYANEEKLIEVVFWLLQHRFLIQMHTHIFFSPDESLYAKVDGTETTYASFEEEVEHSLNMLPDEQRLAILQTPASNVPKDLKLFLNLMKYFDGSYHMEEIMYNENLSRPQLLKLLDKFKPLLVTNLREDDTTAAFCM